MILLRNQRQAKGRAVFADGGQGLKFKEIQPAGCLENQAAAGKFITVDASGNAAPSVMRFDAHNFGKASNVHIAGHDNFARQREDEFDLRSGSEIRLNQKIKAA